MMAQHLSPEDARARLIKRSDMVACKVAFIDCKMPGSERKENYSLVGPGVTQSHDQVVNLTEPHGFSLGVAAMPPGTVNNLHVHFTAEVFMIQRGTWTFRWGADGKDGTIEGKRLLDHFSGPPFGWSPDTVRYMIAALLLAACADEPDEPGAGGAAYAGRSCIAGSCTSTWTRSTRPSNS